VSTINEIVSIGDLPGISRYVDGVDYHLIGGTNDLAWQPGGQRPALGNPYFVTYTEARAASAYNPMLYFDGNLVIADHGGATLSSGEINKVTQGAILALRNGSKGVVVLQLNPSTWANENAPTNNELENSFQNVAVPLLETIIGWKLLMVPMSVGTLVTTTAARILFEHAVFSSQPERKQERSVMVPSPAGLTYTQYAALAASYSHERACVPAIPSSLQMTGFTGTYDNSYYCAALAGRACAGPIGETIHDEIISGITFNDNFTPPVADYLVQQGVSPAKSKGGIIRNIMFITTDTTNALTEDMGVQDIADYVRKAWRERMWAIFRNKPITTDLPADMTQASENFMDALIDKTIVAQYRNLTATQDPTEPRKMRLSGQVQPAYGTAWIDITFTFVLSFSGA